MPKRRNGFTAELGRGCPVSEQAVSYAAWLVRLRGQRGARRTVKMRMWRRPRSRQTRRSVSLTPLLGLVEHSRGLVAISLTVAGLQTAVLLPVAYIVKSIFDQEIPRGETHAIILSGALALGLYALNTLLVIAAREMILRATKSSVVTLRARLLDHLYDLPRSWFRARETGRIHAMLVWDTDLVDRMLIQFLTQTAPAIVVGAALAAVATVFDPLLTGVLGIVVLAMSVVHRIVGARLRRRLAAFQRAFETYVADTHQALTAIDAARIHAVLPWERERRTPHIDRVESAARPLLRIQGLHMAVQGSLLASSAVLVLVAGGVAVAEHTLTLGGLLAYYAIVALLLRQITPAIVGAPVILAGRDALERLEAFLAEQVEQPYQGGVARSFDGDLRLEGVSFAYGEHLVLDHVDLAIEPGEHLVLVGANGAGKSTLLALLLGVERPHTGRVLADGVPFDAIDVVQLRSRIGVVAQEPVLVRGSIAENIAWGRVDPASEEVSAAAWVAMASEFIERLPDGYDTMLGDGGSGLSGGQRQRVAIARALVGSPAVLLLDEPTNHLDRAAIGAIIDRLVHLPNRPGIVSVTHDRSLIAIADRVVSLERGRITSAIGSAAIT
jgi:ABC-type bacteriocin/lantibiotic exporter with double-glycine peptidase domain